MINKIIAIRIGKTTIATIIGVPMVMATEAPILPNRNVVLAAIPAIETPVLRARGAKISPPKTIRGRDCIISPPPSIKSPTIFRSSWCFFNPIKKWLDGFPASQPIAAPITCPTIGAKDPKVVDKNVEIVADKPVFTAAPPAAVVIPVPTVSAATGASALCRYQFQVLR